MANKKTTSAGSSRVRSVRHTVDLDTEVLTIAIPLRAIFWAPPLGDSRNPRSIELRQDESTRVTLTKPAHTAIMRWFGNLSERDQLSLITKSIGAAVRSRSGGSHGL